MHRAATQGVPADYEVGRRHAVVAARDGEPVSVAVGLERVVFDADGAELYARVGLGPIGLIGGFTYLEPDVTDPLIDPDFKTGYVILGAEWFVPKTAKIYSESKIDFSTAATGASGDSVFTIGFRYDFLLRISHQ